MRALFVTYPHVGLGNGGMRVQIDRTAEALRTLGVEVEYFNPWRNQLDSADICHCFSPSGTMLPFFNRAAEKHKPVVWSSIFSVSHKSQRRLAAEVWMGRHVPGFLSGWKKVAAMARQADAVIALTDMEARRLSKVFGCVEDKLVVIPNGTDKRFATGDREMFRSKFGLGEYVLNVAFFAPMKNQLSLIRAMKGSSMSLVLIGKATSGNDGYLQACKAEAGDNVVFAGTFPYGDPMLLSAYAGAKVFALPSTSEVMTISLMEAALAGCRLVASDQVPIVDCLADHVATPSPHSVEQIRQAIETAAADDPGGAREIMLAQPDWNDVGREVLDVYERLLRDR